MGQEQLKALVSMLRQPATRHGYSTDLWTGPRVGDLIQRLFEVEYHLKHMPRLLRRLGLVLKFPERRALEQDPKELRLWKEERFPEITQFAKKKRALVFFADECLISLIPYVGKTWTKPQARPIVRVSGKKQQHFGVTAAINAQSKVTFELTRRDETFTAHVFLRFVRKLRREHPRRFIVLIVDGARSHTARSVKEFAAQNSTWLRIEFLPAYSPELNPSKKPCRYIKTKKLKPNSSKPTLELRQNTKRVLQALKRDKKTLGSFFK
jgi:transposase